METPRSPERPAWWDWELELTAHALKRMVDRRFSEVDLRIMMESATNVRRDEEPGRWIVETVNVSSPWEVVVEPDFVDELLVVITAYPVSSP